MTERRPVSPVPLPGRVGRQLRDGGALPLGGFREGKRTFADYLDTIPGGEAADVAG